MGSRPTPKDANVSRQMSRMPRTSSRPELALRRSLHAKGVRFRLHRKDLPGTPDIVLPSARLAVFVDGCFWHRCPDHAVIPKNNRPWWIEKFDGNVERDRRKDRELREMGWLPVHLWEHMSAEEMAEQVIELWRERRAR